MRTPLLMLMAVVILILSAAVNAAAPAAPADTGGAPESRAAADTPAPLQEVTVLGRLKSEAKITNFVYGITMLENEQGVARWHAPMCPEVAGLTRPQDEFVVERLSQIARAAEAPLAKEGCRPNLFVFVTSEPKALLQAMEKRYFAVAFGNATPTEVQAFINTPRAVRVWHGPYWTATGGAAPMSPGVPPSAHLGNTPSILALFGGTEQAAAPTGMSDWDQAFLKALYNFPAESTMPRSLISSGMMRDLVP